MLVTILFYTLTTHRVFPQPVGNSTSSASIGIFLASFLVELEVKMLPFCIKRVILFNNWALNRQLWKSVSFGDWECLCSGYIRRKNPAHTIRRKVFTRATLYWNKIQQYLAVRLMSIFGARVAEWLMHWLSDPGVSVFKPCVVGLPFVLGQDSFS